MGFKSKEAKGGGSNLPKQDPVAAGTYPGRLVQLIDLGVQKQPDYKGEPKDPIQMIHTTYELSDEFCKNEEGEDETDKPRWFSESFPFYNLDADRAKSTKRYLALDPDQEHDGDWEQLIGSPVMIALTATKGKGKHQGKVFNNIDETSPMRPVDIKRTAELVNPPKVFSLDDVDIDVFMSLPKWLQDIIKGNLDYEGSDLEDAIANYKKPEDEENDEKEEDTSTSDTNPDDGEEGEW